MEKWAYGLLGGTALITLGVATDRVIEQNQADATVPIPALTVANTDQPSLINTMNPLLAGLPGFSLSFNFISTTLPSTTSALNISIVPRSINVDQIVAEAYNTFTCVTPPTLSFVTCATSACAAASQTIIATTPQIAALNIGYNSGQITSGTVIAGGTYVGFVLSNLTAASASSCTALSVTGNIVAH